MRIALLGATGLIGSALLSRLRADGHELRLVGRDAASEVTFDLAAEEELPRDALAGCDALVHAAGVTDEDFSDRRRAFAKSLQGADALMRAARGASVRRLVYVSSAHVYGALEGRIDERRPPDPLSDYALAHFAAEQIVRRTAIATGAAALLLRPCAVFGMPPDARRFRRWSLIPFDFPRQAVDGRIVLKSPGLQERNFVAADSLAALVAAWIEPAEGIGVANAPGPRTLSVYDFALLCARIAQRVTGRECRIERPAASSGRRPPSLEFRSERGEAPAGTDLETHVRDLASALYEKAPS